VSTEIAQYIADVNRACQTGNATEHSYRPALAALLQNLAAAQSLSQLKNLQFTNEPKLIDCGRPDFIVTRNDARIGYIETKDIGIDLNGKACKAQFDRYKQSLDNIIFTDYLDFHRYLNGEFAESVRVAEIKGGKITPIKANFGRFEQLFVDFGTARPQAITSPAEIAQMMANKARLLAENIEESLKNINTGNDLTGIMDAFKQVLIHDITPKEFADVYAQTIAYGLFAARLHDESPDTFCRQKAAGLIPKTNPFLRQLFNTIAGFDLDAAICWIVDDLAETFRAANMAGFRKNFGEHTTQNDPIIYFYENFLSEYDPALRNSRGVYYTPQPVVSFIVRAVDEILQKEFNLPDGLADTTKTTVKINDCKTDVHKVQILDPATGTGTFLAETVNQIHGKYKNQAGIWQSYVKEHLIPRLNGLEILMAPYTMAHIKLELLLSQTGYEAADNQRLRIYLTNSLEKEHKEIGSILAQFLAREANEANGIKRDSPIMVVMGNPPYSGESQNSGTWITDLIAQYKKEPQNPSQNIPDTKWLNNDYVKFIRLGQHFIEKNIEKNKEGGVLAYITDNSFLDSLSFRGMRYNLTRTFDKIYILNLHGNSLKKESAPDGGEDKNVFDIKQGVSINIFVKTNDTKNNARIFYYDLYGKREDKYRFLSEHGLQTVNWRELRPQTPHFFFVPKDFSLIDEYGKGFKIDEMFRLNGVGICSKRDGFTIHEKKESLINTIKEFVSLNDEDARTRFNLGKDTDWTIAAAKKDLTSNPDFSKIRRLNYRPFDIRYTYHSENKGFHARPVYNLMQHFTKGDNVGLVVSPKNRQLSTGYMFITNTITDLHILDSAADSTYIFPLYRYPDNPLPGEAARTPNLGAAIIAELSARIGLRFVEEIAAQGRNDDAVVGNGGASADVFTPIDILDYVYAVLHSPQYRERYKEFLKIDFPRVPYPADAKQFRSLAKIGEKLRKLHLLDGVEPVDGIADFPIPGSDVVEIVPDHDPGTNRVLINNTQFFDNIPLEAWEFYIGGYRPAQFWLKKRKGRTLEFGDIQHYRKIIRVLMETAAVMGEIDV
jgi:predicted helicase